MNIPVGESWEDMCWGVTACVVVSSGCLSVGGGTWEVMSSDGWGSVEYCMMGYVASGSPGWTMLVGCCRPCDQQLLYTQISGVGLCTLVSRKVQ